MSIVTGTGLEFHLLNSQVDAQVVGTCASVSTVIAVLGAGLRLHIMSYVDPSYTERWEDRALEGAFVGGVVGLIFWLYGLA